MNIRCTFLFLQVAQVKYNYYYFGLSLSEVPNGFCSGESISTLKFWNVAIKIRVLQNWGRHNVTAKAYTNQLACKEINNLQNLQIALAKGS